MTTVKTFEKFANDLQFVTETGPLEIFVPRECFERLCFEYSLRQREPKIPKIDPFVSFEIAEGLFLIVRPKVELMELRVLKEQIRGIIVSLISSDEVCKKKQL